MKQINFSMDVVVIMEDFYFKNTTKEKITEIVNDNFELISIPDVSIENFHFQAHKNNHEEYISGELIASIMIDETEFINEHQLIEYIHRYCDGYFYGDFEPQMEFIVDEVFLA